MKKGRIASVVIGSAGIVLGTVAYFAAKRAGRKARARHAAIDETANTPYVPEEAPVEEEQEEYAASDEYEKSPEAEEDSEEQEEAPEPEEDPEKRVIISDPDSRFTDYAQASDNSVVDLSEIEEGPSNLEEYILENPDEKASLDAVGKSFASEGVRTDISFAENTMFFDFVMTDVDDKETEDILKPDLSKFLDDQSETYKGIVKQIEEDTGLSDIKLIVIFMDSEGNEIVSGHYDETGRTM